jgi:aspartate aminotransferase
MTLIAPSANIAGLKESATIAVSARAKALRAAGFPIIDLGAGEPDFPTPQFVVEEAHRALDAGATRYTQVEGILPLREAIAARGNDLRGSTEITASNVVVTTGTKQALFNACFALFGEGDEVLVPTPGWPSYYEMIALSRATAIAVRGSRDTDLKVTPGDLRRAATSRTRGIIMNSPCNPTGAVYSPSELADIAALASEHDWWVVSDEIYREISYDGAGTSMLSVAPSLEKLVVVDGVAKSFAMTGWRIGWSIAPAVLTRSMTALQSQTTSNAATLSQHAALAALTGATSRATIDTMVSEFKRRRDRALEMLRAANFDVIEPGGAFYLFVRAGVASHDDPEPGSTLARRLLEESHVAVVPGVAFRTPEWIRMSYAAPAEQVVEGVRRMIAARIS